MIKFLTRRVIVLAIVLSIIAFWIDGFRIEIPIGLLIGSFLTIYRTKIILSFIKITLSNSQNDTMKSTLILIAIQAMMFLVLLTAVLIDLRFFIGIFIGMLLLMVVICVNSVTERLGMTHNDWGDF